MAKKRFSAYKLSAGFITAIGIIIFWQFLLNPEAFASKAQNSDIIRANVPSYTLFFDNIASGNFSFWSWEMGLGTSHFSHADIMLDPFTWITFLGGRTHIPAFIFWSYFLKIICTALAMTFYLNKMHFRPYCVLVGAAAYALGGFTMVVGNNLALGTIAVYFPLVLASAENWMADSKRFLPLVLLLGAVGLYSYYFYYQTGLLLALYTLVRLWYVQGFHPKRLLLSMLRLFAIGLLGCLLSAFMLLPQIELAAASPRTGGLAMSSSFFQVDMEALTTFFARLLRLDILGNPVTSAYLGYRKDWFDLAPYLTCLTPIFAFQYFAHAAGNIRKRRMLLWVALTTFALVVLPIGALVFNALSVVNHRWMFGLALLFALLTTASLNGIIEKGLDKRYYWGAVAASYILLGLSLLYTFMIHKGQYAGRREAAKLILKNAFWGIIGITIVFAAVYLLFTWNRHRLSQGGLHPLTAGVFLAILCTEIIANYGTWYLTDDVMRKSDGNQILSYQDESAALIQEIQASDSSPFYRIDKNFDSVTDLNGIESENDAMVQQYYGLKNYNSLSNPSYINFLTSMDIYPGFKAAQVQFEQEGADIEIFAATGDQILNYIGGPGERHLVKSYLGVRYYISDGTEVNPIPHYYNELFSRDGCTIYKNTMAYPLAFVKPNILPSSSFQALAKENKDRAMMACTILDDNYMEATGITSRTYHPYTETQLLKLAKAMNESCTLRQFTPDRIRLSVTAKNEGFLSLSMPYDKNWHISINGIAAEALSLNNGLLGAQLPAGTHEIELRYTPKSFYLGVGISAAALLSLAVVSISLKRRGKTHGTGRKNTPAKQF